MDSKWSLQAPLLEPRLQNTLGPGIHVTRPSSGNRKGKKVCNQLKVQLGLKCPFKTFWRVLKNVAFRHVSEHQVNATYICGRSRDELYLHSSGGVDKNNVDLRRPGVVDGLHGDAGSVFAVALLVELN